MYDFIVLFPVLTKNSTVCQKFHFLNTPNVHTYLKTIRKFLIKIFEINFFLYDKTDKI